MSIDIYKTAIVPGKNMIVEEVSSYLNTCEYYHVEDSQYFRIEEATTLVIQMSQEAFGRLESFPFNYVRVVNYRGVPYYYFILSYEWSSTDTIRLNLQLDTLNTFYTYYKDGFTDKTEIIREHEDRLARIESGDFRGELRRIVDPEDEGASPILYTLKRFKYEDFAFKGIDWYLLYINRNDVKPNDLNNPVDCFICPSVDLKIGEPETLPTKTADRLRVGYTRGYIYETQRGYYPSFVVTRLSNGQVSDKRFTVTENKIYVIEYSHSLGDGRAVYDIYEGLKSGFGTYVYTRVQSGVIEWRYDKIDGMSLDNGDPQETPLIPSLDEIMNLPYFNIDAGEQPTPILFRFSDIDRTDPKIIKIIKLPYAPLNFSYSNGIFNYSRSDLKIVPLKGIRGESNGLKVLNLSLEFLNTRLASDMNPLSFKDLHITSPAAFAPKMPRHHKYESKLFHSSLFLKSIMYDTFKMDIPFELVDTYALFEGFDTDEFNFIFKPTNTINSNFIFDFGELKNYMKSAQDYSFMIVARRNNEPVIFNSPYVNYIKTGYNYDKKRMNTDLTSGILTGTLGVFGQALAFNKDFQGTVNKNGVMNMGAGGTLVANYVTSNVSTLISSITSRMLEEESMKNRLVELKNTASSVQGSDDVDLLSYYNGNRINVVVKRCRTIVYKEFEDLFYYGGYSHKVQAVPKLNTRMYFNYIQCSPHFNENVESLIRTNFLNDIKERFNIGVTVYHLVEGEYDFEQVYENWERSLYEN